MGDFDGELEVSEGEDVEIGFEGMMRNFLRVSKYLRIQFCQGFEKDE